MTVEVTETIVPDTGYIVEGRTHRILCMATTFRKLRTKHVISGGGMGASQVLPSTPENNNRPVVTDIATPVAPAALMNRKGGIGAASPRWRETVQNL